MVIVIGIFLNLLNDLYTIFFFARAKVFYI